MRHLCIHCHGFFKGLLFTAIEVILLYVFVPMELCCVRDGQWKQSMSISLFALNTMKSTKVHLLVHGQVTYWLSHAHHIWLVNSIPISSDWKIVFYGNVFLYVCFHCCLVVMILHSICNSCRYWDQDQCWDNSSYVHQSQWPQEASRIASWTWWVTIYYVL